MKKLLEGKEIFQNKIVGWPYVLKEKGASVWKVVNVEPNGLFPLSSFSSQRDADFYCKDLRKKRDLPENGVQEGDTVQKVESSNLVFAGVSSDGLLVGYQGGSVYLYPEQPHHFDSMMKSASKGSYVAKYIKKLPFVQLY